MNDTGGLMVLDRVLRIEPGKSATAIRNVPHTLTIFDSHFPRRPVLPGVLVLGSLGLLAARLLEEQTGRPWRLAGAEQIRYRHFIQPGDQMELTVELKQLDGDLAELGATVTVDGRKVTTARALRMVARKAEAT